jgi:hypothetical protein
MTTGRKKQVIEALVQPEKWNTLTRKIYQVSHQAKQNAYEITYGKS